MSQAQLRAKSGVPNLEESGRGVEAMEVAGFDGKVQIKTAGARSESWS